MVQSPCALPWIFKSFALASSRSTPAKLATLSLARVLAKIRVSVKFGMPPSGPFADELTSDRGLRPWKVTVADGHLGIWSAFGEIFSAAVEQRCWNHRISNVSTGCRTRCSPRRGSCCGRCPTPPHPGQHIAEL